MISPGKHAGKSGIAQEQSGTEAETGAGLNAARAVTGVESWPDEEVWLTGRVEQRQVMSRL